MIYPDLLSVLVDTIRDDSRAPLILLGKPGVGKTELVFDAHKILGWNFGPFVSHPTIMDPTYYAGLPIVSDGTAVLSPIGVVKQVLLVPNDQPCIFFCDDVGHATIATQNALMQLVHARELEGQKLPDGVRVLMASNRRQDKAHIQHGWSTAFKTRFRASLTLEPDLESFLSWGIESGRINDLVIGFLSHHEDFLCESEMTNTEEAHATPRTWEHLSHMLVQGHIPERLEMEVFSGIVGRKAASEFLTFKRFWKSLPRMSQIFSDPHGIEVPSELDAKYASINLVAKKAPPEDEDENGNLKAVMAYVDRYTSEFKVLWTEMVIRHHPEIEENGLFTNWCLKHQKILSKELTGS